MKAISTSIESLAILIAITACAFELGTGIAKADPGQNCKTEWNLMYNVPIGVRTTCFNPDGSYHVCTSLGTDGKGPGTCWDYPAPPQMEGQPTFSPPVPGMPPPPPPAP